MAFALAGLLSSEAIAQSTLPGSAEAGRIEKRFEQPLAPAARDAAAKPIEQEKQAAPAGSEVIRFTLRGVHIDGATVYGEENLTAAFQPRLNQEVTLEEIYALANELTARYAADGYPLAQVVVPPQSIGAEGVVRLQVVEGYVEKVLFEGEVAGNKDLLKGFAEKLLASRPLRAVDLERYLLLINDLPGVSVNGVLRPGSTPGAAELVVVMKQKMVDLFASVDNRGSKYVGPWQIVTGGNLNSVLDDYELTGIRLAGTSEIQEMKYLQLSHERIINSEGTRVGLDASYVASQPGFILKTSDVDSHSRILGGTVKHPLLRSRRENLNLKGRFEAKDVTTDVSGARLSEDRIRVLRGGATYDWVDTLLTPAVSVFGMEASQGFDVLGARRTGSETLSKSKGHSDFFKVTADFNRLQRIVPDVNLLVAATAQWAGASLLSSEQFGFGGSSFGRGFDPADVTSDHGVAGKLELQYVGGELPMTKSWQLYGFYDIGRMWLRKSPDNDDPVHSAASLGGGVRAEINDTLSTSLEVARPVVHGVAARGDQSEDLRVYFGLVAKY